MLNFVQEDGNGARYTVVEQLGGGEGGRHEAGGYSAKNQKLSCWGSVSVNKMQGVLDFG